IFNKKIRCRIKSCNFASNSDKISNIIKYMSGDHKQNLQRLSWTGLLISLGIIFGDIGTSPLYVFKAIFNKGEIQEIMIYGGLSCISWTLTLQTTVKYVIITLNADNKGE